MTKPVTYIILSFSILLLTMISRQHHLLPILLCLETRPLQSRVTVPNLVVLPYVNKRYERCSGVLQMVRLVAY